MITKAEAKVISRELNIPMERLEAKWRQGRRGRLCLLGLHNGLVLRRRRRK